MIEQTDETHAKGDSIQIGPLALWLAAQLLVLALSALRVALWARPPHPIESVAAGQMIVAQIIVAGMLFPWLLPNPCTVACVSLTGAAMLSFAAVLSRTPAVSVALGWVYLTIWLVALWVWRRMLRGPASRLTGMALAGFWVVGIPVLRYLSDEFHHFHPFLSRSLSRADVTGNGLLQINTYQVDVSGLVPTSILLLLGVLALLLRQRIDSSTAYPHFRTNCTSDQMTKQ